MEKFQDVYVRSQVNVFFFWNYKILFYGKFTVYQLMTVTIKTNNLFKAPSSISCSNEEMQFILIYKLNVCNAGTC